MPTVVTIKTVAEAKEQLFFHQAYNGETEAYTYIAESRIRALN